MFLEKFFSVEENEKDGAKLPLRWVGIPWTSHGCPLLDVYCSRNWNFLLAYKKKGFICHFVLAGLCVVIWEIVMFYYKASLYKHTSLDTLEM